MAENADRAGADSNRGTQKAVGDEHEYERMLEGHEQDMLEEFPMATEGVALSIWKAGLPCCIRLSVETHDANWVMNWFRNDGYSIVAQVWQNTKETE